MKENWSSGYVTDLTYSHGYYHELAPPFMRFFLLMNGWGNLGRGGSYNYCELGYGQGVSCNVHAAANPRGQFFGTDFHPDHALFAQGLAEQAGLQAQWLALGFEQMLEAPLPQFDVIALHGVWSWVDPAARHALVEFMRRRLKVGGVVYISYNILPGWGPERPLRDLLWLHTELAGATGAPTAVKIKDALAFAERLRLGKAAFFERSAPARQMLEDMLRDDVHVVAHEYFNRAWHLTYFADLAQALDAAGLGFACSVHRSDITGEVFERAQGTDFGDLAPALRQTANDFLLNRRFRRDLFVRGANKLPPAERQALLEQVGLVLVRPAESVSASLQTPYGTVNLDASIVRRIAAAMHAAPGCISIRDLIERADLHSTPRERVFETIAALVGQSQLSPVFDDDAACAGSARARAMNLAVAERSRHDDRLCYLASPVTGQGIEATRMDRLFLLAWEQGARTPEELCAATWKPGSAGEPGSRGEHAARATQFTEAVLPLWRRLGIVQEASA